ncbi:hypothetical protein HCA50_14605 [Listeria innocua]|uniref:hypothetical protein n=1 Tax=Listeria innocua TaxID=1642 RepID=UPI001624A10B|nr:hypothetical protein [Listeria innocua]MBC1904736.1 hypothetical protein [Listeria innocua]
MNNHKQVEFPPKHINAIMHQILWRNTKRSELASSFYKKRPLVGYTMAKNPLAKFPEKGINKPVGFFAG